MSSMNDPIFLKYGVRQNQAGTAHQTIREAIVSGRLPQGAQLNERAIASEYGFSRTPVRDALTRLAGEGLVEQIPHVGAFVRKLGLEETVELAEFRRTIESGAAAMAATKATQQEVKELLELGAAIDKAAKAEALDERSESESHFHRKVVQLSRNREIARVVESAGTMYLTISPEQVRKGNAAIRADGRTVSHIEVAQAIASRDPVRAFKAMWDHFDNLFRFLDAENADGQPPGKNPRAEHVAFMRPLEGGQA